MACAIGTINAQSGRSLAWASSTKTRDTDAIEYGANLRCITALTCCDHDGKWQAVPIDAQVNFAGNSSP
jgi:hypothetical protein